MVVTFGFSGMSADELVEMSAALAPEFASIPGCRAKTWLLDRAAGRAGGVYTFDDVASVDAYRSSELWQAVEANEQFHDFESHVYEMMDAATALTHGLPQGAGAR
ncbi:MAG: YdhR family protein [Acidimicrobiia bacterium]|nr:YdhR family protein [Acidimicrobiia bacterium]